MSNQLELLRQHTKNHGSMCRCGLCFYKDYRTQDEELLARIIEHNRQPQTSSMDAKYVKESDIKNYDLSNKIIQQEIALQEAHKRTPATMAS